MSNWFPVYRYMAKNSMPDELESFYFLKKMSMREKKISFYFIKLSWKHHFMKEFTWKIFTNRNFAD